MVHNGVLRSITIIFLFGITSNLICQNSYNVEVDQPDPLMIPSICVVSTVDTNNIVVWEKTNSLFTTYFGVYRESTSQTGQWDLLGQVDYSDNSIFIDSTSNPENQSYNYRISAIDLCGNETGLSVPHKTMNLSIALGINNSFSLIWSEYEGFVVNSYGIYRGTSEGGLIKIASTAGGNFNYNDNNPPSGDVYYQIEVISPNDCDPTQLKSVSSYSSSKSNIVSFKTTGLSEERKTDTGINVYPNPFSEKLYVKVPGAHIENYNITIFDITGKKVFQQKIISNPFEFIRGDLPNGLYIIEVEGDTIFRNKIVIAD